jgi:hypothetical protein
VVAIIFESLIIHYEKEASSLCIMFVPNLVQKSGSSNLPGDQRLVTANIFILLAVSPDLAGCSSNCINRPEK